MHYDLWQNSQRFGQWKNNGRKKISEPKTKTSVVLARIIDDSNKKKKRWTVPVLERTLENAGVVFVPGRMHHPPSRTRRKKRYRKPAARAENGMRVLRVRQIRDFGETDRVADGRGTPHLLTYARAPENDKTSPSRVAKRAKHDNATVWK